jgi:hypothetical protein
MPGISVIMKILLQLLAGVGIATAMDKFLPNKVAGYEEVSPGFRPRKLLFFALAFGGGALAWNFLNRKFHILSRRHAPRRKRSRKR